MKILLIYPYCLEDRLHEEDARVVPMGVYYVGALLKENGYDVEILNFYHLHKTPMKVREILMEKKPDVVGFSVLNANRWGAIEIARIAKEIDPKVITVFGGVSATFLWEHFLKHFQAVDVVVIGEGEYSFLNLIQSLERDRDLERLNSVRGIAFRKGDEIVKTEPEPPVRKLDELPIPAKYFTYQHVSLTRGCPGNCTFCGSPRFWKRKVRFHSSEYFVNQLELLYQKGINFFYVSDDTFTLKPDHVITICKKILEKNLRISWAAISHVNYINETVLYWMRKAGCIQISYGVESGSDAIRKLLNKDIQKEQIQKAFSLTMEYGMLARAYFIYGCPGENEDTIRETLDLIRDIKPLSAIFYILDIFPGTALYEDFKRTSHATDDIWLNRIEDVMYFENDPMLSKEQILAFGQTLRTQYYEMLSDFTDEIRLADEKEFYPLYADFFSKLAMTFSHGDYSQNDAIRDKEGTARKLYEKALSYFPNHHAYLGLGILMQKSGEHKHSVGILSRGITHFPDSEALNMCIGISYMNQNEYAKALPHFLRFQHSKEAVYHISNCYNALGDVEIAAAFLKKFRGM